MNRAVAALALLAACGDDPIAVSRRAEGADYNRAALLAAVARFVEAGRTPEAYGALAREVARLRPGMDDTVAELAELELTVLAAAPVEATRAAPPAERTARLATTVWPVALAGPIEALAPDGWRSTSDALVALRDGETADAYVRRLCDGALAVECRHVVPEWQGAIVGAEAIARMTQRVRTAVATCEECDDPAWQTAVGRWEALDRAATADRRRFEDLGATSRWPVAGAAASPWPADAPLITIASDGDWLLAGAPIDPSRRADVLRDGRTTSTLGVHLTPSTRVEALEALAAAAKKAGYSHLAIQARVDRYPWDLRAYLIPTKRPRLGRSTDTIQVLLRRLDVKRGAARAP